MAGKEDAWRNNWSCKSGCRSEEKEEWFLEGFHLDCFPLVTKGRNARPAPAKEKGEGKV